MTETRKLRVFLCHSSQDKPIVRELYQRLNAEGWIDPWLDEEKLLPGQDWEMEIEKAVEAADAVVICLSNSSVTKEGYVQKEIRFVLDVSDEKIEETIFVLPLRLNECMIPRRLKKWQYVDLFPSEKEGWAYSRLLQAFKVRLGQLVTREKELFPPKEDEKLEFIAVRFWNELLGKGGGISIFTGASHNELVGREMISDWDLRAASELTSYFASHQYRAIIESPVYQIEHVVGKRIVDRAVYIEKLEEMVSEKNCVIIASPDVNPLTELLLGKIYGIDKEYWFGADPEFDAANYAPNAVVAFKRKPIEEGVTADSVRVSSTFYREYTDKGERERGFLVPFVKAKKIAGGFVSQTATPEPFTVHAHLVVVPNPYCSRSETQKFIVILNGVSGPATFALTHVLTGGVSREFVSYGQNFDPNSESEKILKQILEEINSSQREKHGYHCIIEVKVGPPKEEVENKSRGRGIFDWRHIHEWKLIRGVVFELTK